MENNVYVNPAPADPKKTPAYAVAKYNGARSNLLIAIVLTVVNIVIGYLGSGLYLVFSISFPYYMFDLTDLAFLIPSVVILALYVVYYLCSKKETGFMIAAMVTFILDILFLIGYSYMAVTVTGGEISYADFIIDYAAHVWVLIELIIGVKYSKRYKAAITDDPSLVAGNIFKNASIPAEPLPEAPAFPAVNVAEEDIPAQDAADENDNID